MTIRNLAATCIFVFVLSAAIFAQTTAFTYQGSLKDGANPANGNYDLEFKLFDAVSDGAQQGSTIQRLNVAVANGIFSVTLDFGAGTLSGADRFLDIAVRTAGGGAFTALTPRQQVNSAPYSVKSLNSTTADLATNAEQLGGVAANQYVVTTDPRMTDARDPLSGSSNYIQNQNAAAQPSSNFSISGNGTAGGTLSGNIINATTQYNINGTKILSNAGTSNIFAGEGAGTVTTASGNSFFGRNAGAANTTGGSNSIFGAQAGENNVTGASNVFVGVLAGQNNTTGSSNSFFGRSSGLNNVSGTRNTLLGTLSNVVTNNLTNATAVGAFAAVDQSNSLVLGSIVGVNNCSAATNCASTNVGIGTTTPSERLHVAGNGLFTGNLSVSGSGTIGGTLLANIVDSTTQYNIGGSRVLSNAGSNNLFVGIGAGAVNTGSSNSFFGTNAGAVNTTGVANSFFGAFAGSSNTTAIGNSFFGRSAGAANTTGESNSFFGNLAGTTNSTGHSNTFFGASAGEANTSGYENSFFGRNAGAANTVMYQNSFFGANAGAATCCGGSSNSFFGANAGLSNTSGSGNAFFGREAGKDNTAGGGLAFFGSFAGDANTTGNFNSFFGNGAGRSNTTGSDNTFVGRSAGTFSNTTGSNNSLLGASSEMGGSGLVYAAAIGARAQVDQSNSIVLGAIAGINSCGAPCGDTKVGIGTTTPADRLHVNGIIRVTTLGAAGGQNLCLNALTQISTCSSSLRYKTNIGQFSQGLSFVNKLRAISFDWKDGGLKDVGFGAEDVAKIDPRFVTYNSSGEVEGVKYDRMTVVLVNAMKEQQTQIEQQQKRIEVQNAEIDAMKQFICSQSPAAAFC